MVVGIEKCWTSKKKRQSQHTQLEWTWPKAYIAENETSEHLAEHEAYLKFSKPESAPKMSAMGGPQVMTTSSWSLSI